MDDVDRILGKLEAFKEFSEREFQQIRQDISELKQFKWKVYGGAGVISTIISAALAEKIKRLP